MSTPMEIALAQRVSDEATSYEAGAEMIRTHVNEATATVQDVANALRLENRTLRSHATKLAGQLAECAGYLAAVRIDRKWFDGANTYALQTPEWAEGAKEIVARANALLDKHDAALAKRTP